MLPFPIFLFLLFSATLLAPLPTVLVGSFKIVTLQSFEWSTLPASIPDPQPPEAAALISLLVPPITPDTLPTQCGPNSMHVANSTIPQPFVHLTDDRTTSTAVLLVVSLAMLNCLVYKLLVDESNGTHDAEVQSTLSPLSAAAAAPPPQECMHHHAPTVKEMPHPLLLVDTAKPISESLEHESLLHLVKDPSTPSFETIIPCNSPAPLVLSLLFPALSCNFSLDNSEKTTVGDSTPPTLLALDAPSVFATRSTAFEVLSTMSIESAVRIDNPDVEPPESNSLDTEAAKETDVPHPLESEPTSNDKLQDSSVPSPAIEDDCEFDADEQDDVFCYQPLKSESDGDESFDYDEEVDCTVEEPTPPASASEDEAFPSPHLRPLLGSRGHSLDYSPSLSAKKWIAAECAARYASDDIQVRTKGEIKGETISITRCISADDLSGMFATATGNAAHDSTISDRHSQIFQPDIIDGTAHKQVTLLRADAPIFKPRSSGMNEMTSLAELRPPVSAGLKASIHAPRDEGVSQTQGCAGVSESIDATRQACAPPERPIEMASSYASVDADEEPEVPGSAQPTRSPSPGVSGGVYASIHAPPNPSTGVLLTPGDNIGKSKEPTGAMTRSISADNDTQSGLYASIHAPARCPPNQSALRPSKHHTDVPNWAAICKAQNSSSSTASSSSFQAQRGNSPDLAPLNEGAPDSEPPTTTRCASKNQQGRSESVDNSDGSLVYVDDQEGTAGSGETDSTLAEADDPNEQDFSKPSRRTRRRGKPRRPRQKVPYVPPPRMRNLTERPVLDVLARGQTANAPSVSLHYTHAPPPLPHHQTSASSPMIPPNGIMHDQFGQHAHYPHHSPHMVPIPGFQPPGPHDPRFYPLGPHS